MTAKLAIASVIYLLIILQFDLFAQKKTIDHSTYTTWERVGIDGISPDGRYISWSKGKPNSLPILTLQSTNNSWKLEMTGASQPSFTNNSRYFIYRNVNDTLCIVNLEKNNITTIERVKSYKIPDGGFEAWIAYLPLNRQDTLVLKNLHSNDHYDYPSVTDFAFSNDGQVLLLQTSDTAKNKATYSLIWIDLPRKEGKTILTSPTRPENITFDAKGKGLAFSILAENSTYKRDIKYYRKGMDSATTFSAKPTRLNNLQMDANLPLAFTNDGKYIILHFKEFDRRKTSMDQQQSSINIWRYQDERLLSEQQKLLEYGVKKTTAALWSPEDDKTIILNDLQDIYSLKFQEYGSVRYALFINPASNRRSYETLWPSGKYDVTLIYLDSVCKVPVVEGIQTTDNYVFPSKNGNYIVWYDMEKRNYFSYNIHTKCIKNISSLIPFHIYDEENDRPQSPSPYGLCGFSAEKENYIFVYDQYDIWKIDLDANQKPSCITNYYGRNNKTVLRNIDFDAKRISSALLIKDTENLVLAGFNKTSKYNGFFLKKIGDEANPKLLTMDPYIYYFPSISPSSYISFPTLPVKAKFSNTYALYKMSCSEAPNIIVTKNFKHFTTVSNIHPTKSFNWINSELIHWKTSSGIDAEGIIYKPDNFDVRKKYPVIFYFYEKLSDNLNKFIYPDPSEGRLNIPYYVSNGYLVFIPNIYYNIGYPGESVLDCVESAARYLSKKTWVDSTRLGIQGHSFGGYEVNYLVSNTNTFAAAAESAGLSDMVSMYNNIRAEHGISHQYYFETGQGRIGATLWENPSLYIRNSPIFKASHVKTPLLIMHNKDDGAVPWSQGIEWYNALKRLEKKVWMLQYDGEGHGLDRDENKLDFTIRLSQFFNHYLKNDSLPNWML